MAFVEVEGEKQEGSGTERNFFKFNAIGDKLGAYFISKETKTKTFRESEGPKTFTEYTFRDKNGVDQVITPPYDLAKKLEKADLAPGTPVIMEFKSTKDTGQSSPMKVIGLKVDRDESVRKIPEPKAFVPKAKQEEDAPF